MGHEHLGVVGDWSREEWKKIFVERDQEEQGQGGWVKGHFGAALLLLVCLFFE